MRRMDKYKDETTSHLKRSEVNKDLYQDLANNPKYTDISNITNTNVYEIDKKEDLPTSSREKFQQMKRYNMDVQPKVKKELDDFKTLYQTKERKVYDINSVLEEARKNRQEKDELEEKRKLKYTSYNILAGVNLEELAKYREEKKQRSMTQKEEEIRSLMDTTATYKIGDGMKGTIGIIGPKRMDYDKVVKTLKSITGQLDSLYKKKK